MLAVMSTVPHHHARRAAAARHHGADSPEAVQAAGELEDAKREAAIVAAVAAIPAPTPEQIARIRALLPPALLAAPDGEAVAS
jgi:hypothetical protein